MAQLNVFALITLIVVIMIIIFLVMAVVYFYRIWHLQPPSIGESIALFWTGLVFVVMYVILAIYCLWHLFYHTEKVAGDTPSEAEGYLKVPQLTPAPSYPYPYTYPSLPSDCDIPTTPMFAPSPPPMHYGAHDIVPYDYSIPSSPMIQVAPNTISAAAAVNNSVGYTPTPQTLNAAPNLTSHNPVAGIGIANDSLANYNNPDSPTMTTFKSSNTNINNNNTTNNVASNNNASMSSTTGNKDTPVTVTSQPPKLVPLLA